jgi:hypothetical protein
VLPLPGHPRTGLIFPESDLCPILRRLTLGYQPRLPRFAGICIYLVYKGLWVKELASARKEGGLHAPSGFHFVDN